MVAAEFGNFTETLRKRRQLGFDLISLETRSLGLFNSVFKILNGEHDYFLEFITLKRIILCIMKIIDSRHTWHTHGSLLFDAYGVFHVERLSIVFTMNSIPHLEKDS